MSVLHKSCVVQLGTVAAPRASLHVCCYGECLLLRPKTCIWCFRQRQATDYTFVDDSPLMQHQQMCGGSKESRVPKALLQQYFCPVLVTLGDWAWTNLEQEGLHNSIVLLRFAPTGAASTLAHATPPWLVMQVLSYQTAYISCHSARRKSYTSKYPPCACHE